MDKRIVVLDGATLNPGDNPWTPIEELGPVDLYKTTTPQHVVERLSGAAIAVTNKVKLPADVIAQLPELEFVAVTATGYDVVDTVETRARGIPVSNVPTYGTDSVAQYTFALLLELCHHVALHSKAVHDGEWQTCGSFSFWKTPQIELAGLTLGVIGFGRIGRRVAEIGRAFGMTVLASSHNNDRQERSDALPVEWASVEEIAERSDVVTLHCSLTPSSRQLVNRDFLSRMKPSAFLINPSRGALIDESALADALNAGRLAGAALDVASQEPVSSDNLLLSATNCLMTPHIAWSTLAARRRMMQTSAENIRAFLAGTPRNVVNNV